MNAKGMLLAFLFLATPFSPAWAWENPDDGGFGKSFQAQKELQILNPTGAEVSLPPGGLDGAAAGLVLDKYRSSFRGCQSGQRAPAAGFASESGSFEGLRSGSSAMK